MKARGNGNAASGLTTTSRRRRALRFDDTAVRYGPLGRDLVRLGGVRGGYHSAQVARESGRGIALAQSADAHAQYDLATIRAESQAFARDNGLFIALLRRLIDFILGEKGLMLQAKTASRKANAAYEERWRRFMLRPEVRGLDSGREFQRKLFLHYLVDGDHLLLKLREERLVQMVVADRLDHAGVASPATGHRYVDGVELDARGRVVRFWVRDYDAHGNLAGVPTEIDPADAIYLAYRERSDQTRGMPIMQSNFAMFHRVNDACDSEAAGMQLMSKLAVAVSRKDAGALALTTSEEDSAAQPEDLAKRVQYLADALIFNCEPGEEAKGIEHNVPGRNWVENIKMFARFLGLPLGFSLEFVLLMWSDTSYSAGRAAIKQAERFTGPLLEVGKDALSDLYLWQQGFWIAEDKTLDRPDRTLHEWHVQPYPMLDAQKEEAARKERLSTGSTSPTREGKLDGIDDDDLVAEQQADVLKRCVAAAAINAKFPEALMTWRDFTGLGQRAGGAAPPAIETPVEAAKPAGVAA